MVAGGAPLVAASHDRTVWAALDSRALTATPSTIEPRRWRFVWPRPVRALLMLALFGVFFLGSPVLALLVVPLVMLASGERGRERVTHVLHLGMKLIMQTARVLGVVGLELVPPPPSVPLDRPYVMIANHPTFIDMLIILGTFPRLTCVTNGRWWKHWALGRLLRSTLYLAGPGSGRPESDDMLGTMVAHLGKGHPLLIFPEGQRSLPDGLRRFRRGAVEAAVRANVPILPLFVAVDRPYLTKNVSIWRPPAAPPTYRFEWFEPVLPSEQGGDGKRIHESLEALYERRFEEQLGRWRALPG